MPDSRLTLLVVADGGSLLPSMLAHHRGLVDEVVVVDTGEGAAAAAATGASALVVPHAWDDDFAAARNAGLAAGSGDWVLVMDTDELVAPGDFARLRAALAEPLAVRLMPTVNYLPDSGHPEWRPVPGRYPHEEQGQTGCFLDDRARLFPRREDLRFQGRIHETILLTAEMASLPVVSLDVPVHHYGYMLSADHRAERRGRYRRLARLDHAERPDEPTAILALATVELEEGNLVAASRLLAGLVARTPVDRTVTRGRYLLGRIRREAGDLAGAAEILGLAVRDDPGLVFCWIEWSRVLTAAGSAGECERVLREARLHLGDDPLLAKEELRCLLKAGRMGAATAALARLRAAYPGWHDLQRLAARLVGKE